MRQDKSPSKMTEIERNTNYLASVYHVYDDGTHPEAESVDFLACAIMAVGEALCARLDRVAQALEVSNLATHSDANLERAHALLEQTMKKAGGA